MEHSGNSSTLPPGNNVDKDDNIHAFFSNHIWVPVAGSAIVLAIVCGIIYAACKFKRQRSRYDYSALEEDLAHSTVVIREKQLTKAAQRDEALLNCSFFLRSSGDYTLIDHLPEIGSRDTKQWFLVKDREKPKLYVLTVMPKSLDTVLPFTSHTEKYLNELFQSIEHPYIFPLKEVCFQYEMEKCIVIYPYRRSGSVKDYLYHSHCLDDWDRKHNTPTKPQKLPPGLLKLYGRQVLEGMLQLKQIGFPFYGNLHSANVILEDKVCRISGYENGMLSIPPKLSSVLKKYAMEDMKHFDVLSFGHFMYEMAIGQELDTAIPESRHYLKVKNVEVIEVLKFIFNTGVEHYPSIRTLTHHKFFKDVKLSELVLFNSASQPPKLAGIKNLLKGLKKSTPLRRRSTRRDLNLQMPSANVTATGSELSFPSISTARTTPSMSKSEQQLVPMTSISSTSQIEDYPDMFHIKPRKQSTLFAENEEEETNLDSVSVFGGASSILSQPSTKSKRLKKGKNGKKSSSIGSTTTSTSTSKQSAVSQQWSKNNVPERSSEMTALLSEIKAGITLRKSYMDSDIQRNNQNV